MIKKLFYLLVLLCAVSCQPRLADVQKIERLEKELAATRKALAATTISEEPSAFVHVVYLNTKADISTAAKAQLKEAITRLAQIPEVENLQLGSFKNMNDSRAMSDFEMTFQMSFNDSAAYVIYQMHPIHLELRTIAKELLEGPPVTYDYWLEPSYP
jgi:hypothetical protein